MLKTASLTAFCVLCLTQALPSRVRTISNLKTTSVPRDEHSTNDHASALPRHYSSLLHSRSRLHVNENKLLLRLSSTFSTDKVADLEATKTSAAEKSGMRREKQVDRDERRYRNWTSLTTANSRATTGRLTEMPYSGPSFYTLERQRPNRVDMTSKKSHAHLSRASNRNRLSTALRNHYIDMQPVKKSHSLGLNAEQSENRSRRRRTAVSDNNFENLSSNELNNREQLSLRSIVEVADTDFSYDEALGEENERKDERDLEEFVQKRQSDEIMISRAVLDAMSERIYARVKDFIDKNTKKKSVPAGENKEAESTTVPAGETKKAETTTVSVGETKEAETTTVSVGETKEAETTTVSVGETKEAETTTVSVGETKEGENTTIHPAEEAEKTTSAVEVTQTSPLTTGPEAPATDATPLPEIITPRPTLPP